MTTSDDLPLITMTVSTDFLDWKQRCEQLQIEHQLDLERIRRHYDEELKEKVNEIRLQLKREYDDQFAEFRQRLLDQQRQMLFNISDSADQSYGEHVREQLRLAESPTIENEDLKRSIEKLHKEGIHVLTLSELLSLQQNGIHLDVSIEEENAALRTLIGQMRENATNQRLIQSLAEIFRCEQERRLKQIRGHKVLEEEIHQMCDYQRDALGKLLSEDRFQLIEELQQTKDQLDQLKWQFETLTIDSNQLNQFYFKYLRCEAYRKALIYQKRYLIVLLTGYQDTERFALNEIRRLTGLKTSSFSIFSPRRFRFRCFVRVVIGVIRMRWLVKKWKKKLTTTLY